MSKKVKIGILGALDGIANGKRILELKKFLESKGCSVKIFASKAVDEFSFRPSITLFRYKVKEYLSKRFSLINRPLIEEIFLRSNYWGRLFSRGKIDVLIAQGGVDSYLITQRLPFLKICDAPCIWSEEAKYSQEFSRDYSQKLTSLEKKIYQSADFFCFHWYTYAEYYKKHLDPLADPFTLNWGCDRINKENQAQFDFPPKIVFVGSLKGYWHNIKLLSFLAKISPFQIDIYGPDKPSRKWGLNYLGYAASLKILSQYQFGLITITKDRLRRQGFSSKQMLYASYGLPFLIPEWRKDELFEGLAIPYNERDFVEKVKKYSKRKKWEEMKRELQRFDSQHYWDKNLEPLWQLIKENYQG